MFIQVSECKKHENFISKLNLRLSFKIMKYGATVSKPMPAVYQKLGTGLKWNGIYLSFA
jgi:hypothetical protein